MNDNGKLDNVHNLNAEDLKERVTHLIDICKQDKSDKGYKEKYDPSVHGCEKAQRGPLESWLDREVQGANRQ